MPRLLRATPEQSKSADMAEPLNTGAQSSILPTDLATALFGRAHNVTLAPGEMLFQAGDPCTGCYQVKAGLLKVTLDLASGRERILAILGPGALVGELSVIDGSPRSARVTALRAAQLSFVSRADFEAFADRYPQLFRAIAAVLAQRIRDINGALAAASFLSVRGRAARTLLTLADAFGKDVGSGRILIRHKVSQGDLAAMAGIARENLSRILQDFMRAKVVSRFAGYYCLENKAVLEREVGLADGQ
jgi:CRP/FNR family transcriptional regulator, cyclic AMP receptor protein